MPNKRKKNTLSLETKVQILEKLDQGIQGKRLALEFDVAPSAITYIKSMKSSILSAVSNTYHKANKKSLHFAEYPKLECTLTGPILKEKAKQIFKVELKICGEILCSDVASVSPFIHRFRAKVDEMGLMESQIYNVDETGLFYRCLPDKTYVSLFENTDGSHKLMPLVIGKAKKPRSFQGFNNPLHYNFSKNAWMTSRIFHDWFHKIFIHEVIRFSQENNLPPKAILLIDNCSAHAPIEKLQSDDGNIIAFFFLPNVTATLQPMDQNPIKLTKLNYRSMLLSQLIAEGGDLKVRLKSFSIRNAIMLLKQAWYDVPERVIKKSWSKLNNWDSDQYESDDDDVPLAQLLQKDQDCNGALQAAQALLTEIEPTNNISIPEIEIWNNDVLDDDPAHDLNSDDESSGSSEFDDREVLPVVFTSTAIESVNNLIKWYTYSESFSAKHTSNLLALRNEIVIAETNKRKKQTAITDYMPAN
ncbi:jerky protein homolog-like [Anastrepha ludens]|uniref:jerky protein homolog-like n=1 Tax=Anastrepha ludens TaxID=28586 RepID=UPI0023B17656|nr:jerky protein homolog-like [Anastrepha ludens]